MMLESVKQGRKVIINPCSGNSYYEPVDTPVRAAPLFRISPCKEKVGANSKVSRLTLQSQELNNDNKNCHGIPHDAKYFNSQPLLTNSTRSAFWSRDDLAFSKSDIESVQLLSQIDKKFLCCILKVERELILVLFDQHAVHERIRLEQLIGDHKRRLSIEEGSINKCDLSALQSTACHGAIKFGDKLDRSASLSLLQSLTRCSLPFQCAHGRPSIAPLLNISKLKPNSYQYTVDWNKLKVLRTRIVIKHENV